MTNGLTSWGRTGLYITVFIAGASVMVIELLGTRLIAPFYGASLYVWSSLIAVAMIALASGYFIGGKWSDRAQRTGLSLIIALAALLTLVIPWLTHPVLLATDSLGLRAGAFTSALILFSPSLTMLGMVSPFAIKLATVRLEGVGSSAGTLYAISTVGSVVGTLLLGFFLFPLIGSREILIGLGIILSILAILIALYEQKKLAVSHALWPCVFLAILGVCLLPQIVNAGYSKVKTEKFTIRYEQESLYGWVRVIDEPEKDLRFLSSDASMIGAASISSGQSLLAYQQIVGLIPALKPPMHKALIIGLGAGHMAIQLNQKYNIKVDTLEIDPAVAKAAVDYFGFKSSGMDIVGDARYQIRHLLGGYDLIIHDCFTGGSEPSHLLTKETLVQLRNLLNDQGILAINFVSFWEQGNNIALASVAKTLASVFPHQLMFISEPDSDFNDFIFLASEEPINLDQPSLKNSQRLWLQKRLRKQNSQHGFMLTDNLNPLEHLQTRKAEHYRNILIDWFGSNILLR